MPAREREDEGDVSSPGLRQPCLPDDEALLQSGGPGALPGAPAAPLPLGGQRRRAAFASGGREPLGTPGRRERRRSADPDSLQIRPAGGARERKSGSGFQAGATSPPKSRQTQRGSSQREVNEPSVKLSESVDPFLAG